MIFLNEQTTHKWYSFSKYDEITMSVAHCIELIKQQPHINNFVRYVFLVKACIFNYKRAKNKIFTIESKKLVSFYDLILNLYSPPQSPNTVIRSLLLFCTAVIADRSSLSNAKEKTFLLSAICSLRPSLTPTIAPPTASWSKTQRTYWGCGAWHCEELVVSTYDDKKRGYRIERSRGLKDKQNFVDLGSHGILSNIWVGQTDTQICTYTHTQMGR